MVKSRLPLRFGLPIVAVVALSAGAGAQARDRRPVVHVLFVGDSFTHGRYDPVRRFAGGYDTGPGAAAGPHVHDLLCPSVAGCDAAEAVAPTDPDRFGYPPGDDTPSSKLAYLTAHAAARYAETGPFGGVPGIVLRLAQEEGVRLDVSILAVSASTLGGRKIGGNAANAALIESARWDRVVLQDQSSQPLPARIVVAGRTVATKGDPGAFASGVAALVSGIDAADRAAGRAPIPVTLFQTPPMASYGYTSDDPAEPLFGTSYRSVVDAPYVGADNPLEQMEGDIRAATRAVAAGWNATNSGASHLDVAPVGDAWLAAIRLGVARRDPYLARAPHGAVDLWDADVLDACCTVPIGYHPSPNGAYLDALVLLGSLAGRDPARFGASDATARALGVAPGAAVGLQAAASQALQGRPVR